MLPVIGDLVWDFGPIKRHMSLWPTKFGFICSFGIVIIINVDITALQLYWRITIKFSFCKREQDK